ncbi:tumor necrosis factor receptor superfamily member 5-like [Echeneis naucrates]|uniref:tumor necrosis factor receptor superfamily member 5-like n=1 Tax=Echeneis naucrates TaxID=173247 RepID=UPI0011139FF8|nr:tumor necrosis factor receptor superfamily member 5-like [Echeneis naucrates]
MQSLFFLAFAALSSQFFHYSLSIECNKTQYSWPVNNPTLCCNMCQPGQRMVRRNTKSCEITCKACEGDRYTEFSNLEMSCHICKTCKNSNMEYKLHCNATHNAVCRCKDGYKCEDQSCTQCVPASDTTTPTLPSFTTATTSETITTLLSSSKPVRDTLCFLVIIALLCVGLALAFLTKIKGFLRWIRSMYGRFIIAQK